MPRFFFHARDCERSELLVDYLGEDLPDEDAARVKARRMVCEVGAAYVMRDTAVVVTVGLRALFEVAVVERPARLPAEAPIIHEQGSQNKAKGRGQGAPAG